MTKTWAQEADAQVLIWKPSLAHAAVYLAEALAVPEYTHQTPDAMSWNVTKASAHIRTIRRTLPPSRRIGRRYMQKHVTDPTWHLWAALEHIANAAACLHHDEHEGDDQAAQGLRCAEAHLREWWHQTQQEQNA